MTAAPALAQSAGDPVDDELLVEYLPGEAPDGMSLALEAAGAISARAFLPQGLALSSHPLADWRHVILAPGTDDDAAMAEIAADPSVESVIPNVWGEALVTPNDPQFPSQWSLHNTGQTGGTPDADVDGPEGWDSQTLAAPVVIAITDTGIDYTHPDLAGNMWNNPGEVPGNGVDDDGNGIVDDVFGADFFNGDADPFDDSFSGHGTHVAGTAGAVGNNGVGVTGVAWDVQLMAVKWISGGSFGVGTCAGAIDAVVYSILEGADVINASWRMPDCATLEDAIDLAGSQGILFVAAAGNFLSDNDVFPMEPATFPLLNILAVAATDDDDQLAWFSNFGDETVEIAAPGMNILSTLPGGGYGLLSGTSMAAPHVSGVAALILARHPEITIQELKTSIVLGGNSLPSLAGLVLERRRLNLARALNSSDTWAGSTATHWTCDDGVDNDGDGLTDFPEDPGCAAPFDPADPFAEEDPACDDGLDNDGDGRIDFPDDPNCGSASDDREARPGGSCGIGFELALVLLPLMGLRRLRRRRGGG